MNKRELKRIIASHGRWLKSGEDAGQRADFTGKYLQDADFQGKNLRKACFRRTAMWRADLRGADLRDADLEDADLAGADLRGALLADARVQSANLDKADLRGADINFSGWPLWCGSFDVVVDERIYAQLIAHVARVKCRSRKKWVLEARKDIRKYADEFCKFQCDVERIERAEEI